jgi:serine/threonine-protein kinase
MGSLTVDAIPWAEVWVGGKRLGETPIAGVPLEAGEVRVKLKNPKTGNQVTRTVLVRRGHEALLKEDLR